MMRFFLGSSGGGTLGGASFGASKRARAANGRPHSFIASVTTLVALALRPLWCPTSGFEAELFALFGARVAF